MSVSTVQIGEKSVIVVDCSNFGNEQLKEVISTLQNASSIVASKPEKSVSIITDVSNLKFNNDVADAFKEYASKNTPYVKESVIVGLSGLQSIIFAAIKAVTKREFKLAKNMDEAKKIMETA